MRADDGVHFERPAGDLIAREVLRRLNQPFRPHELADALGLTRESSEAII